MSDKKLAVWQSPSGVLHWLRGCTAGGGRHRMRNVRITEEQYAEACAVLPYPGKACFCLRRCADAYWGISTAGTREDPS